MGGLGGYGNNNAQENEADSMQRLQSEDQMSKALFPWQSNSNKPPRKESLWDMLKFTFCAQSKILSFVTIMLIILTIIFIVELALNGIKRSGAFLEVETKNKYIYTEFCNNGLKVYGSYQIWRLFTCIFLHASLEHITLNGLSFLIWGSFVEHVIGSWEICCIFFISGNLIFFKF